MGGLRATQWADGTHWACRRRGEAGAQLEDREQTVWFWLTQVWLGPHCVSLVDPGLPLGGTARPLVSMEVTVNTS